MSKSGPESHKLTFYQQHPPVLSAVFLQSTEAGYSGANTDRKCSYRPREKPSPVGVRIGRPKIQVDNPGNCLCFPGLGVITFPPAPALSAASPAVYPQPSPVAQRMFSRSGSGSAFGQIQAKTVWSFKLGHVLQTGQELSTAFLLKLQLPF